MKTDKLERFILDNREGFDTFEPSQDVWKKIKKPEKKSISLNWKTIAIRAAAVVVIFISSYYFHDFMNSKNTTVVAESNSIEENPLYKNLIEAELYYSAEINYKKKEFFRLTNNSPALQKAISMELSDLDVLFKDLKEDLNDNADNHEVIEAMIQNYRIKLEILEDMLNQIKPEQKNNNHEEIHITI